MNGGEPPDSRNHPSVTLHGLSGSPGVGVGPAIVIGRTATPFKRRKVPDCEVDIEVERFRVAVQEGECRLREVITRAGKSVLGELAILDAYVLMLGDPVLNEEVERKIRLDRKCSEWAVASTVREFAAQLEGAQDPYLRERSHDFDFVGELLVRVLQGAFDVHPLVKLEHPCIVVAHDLSPADTAALAHEPILGIVTERGTRTGHTAIIARALEIPAVVGVTDALQYANPADEIVVDGFRGEVVIRPTQEQRARAARRAEQHRSRKDQLQEAVGLPVVMACGTPVTIRANIQLPEEATLAVQRGAQGIGLYRTEFMYINRTSLPSEDEQFETYRGLVQTVAPRSVTLRTFDIGGDKFASSIPFPSELNPALGLRAIRLGLSRPDILREQLRAMVRASAHGRVRIMLPMIATLTELREIKRMLASVIEDMDRRGIARNESIPLGVMLEVPSALVLADLFAAEADFMSVGTNDLIQYTLAADRTNRSLAYLSSPFDPAILRLIGAAVKAAERHDTPLSVCGEMASDPLGAIVLVGLGLRELSMEGASVPEIKESLRRVHRDEAENVARQGLALDTAEHVEQLVARTFAPRLVDLLQDDPES
jgi:phosphotransferase system enzyme I (PtsI)